MHISATEAPTASNSYGVFRLDYCGKVDGIERLPFTRLPRRHEQRPELLSARRRRPGLADHGAAPRHRERGASGSGRLQKDNPFEHSAFAFAYDASLYRREDDDGDQCFSRDASDADTGLSVWRYGLYDADTGARVTRSSGFPIEFTAAASCTTAILGYYGLSAARRCDGRAAPTAAPWTRWTTRTATAPDAHQLHGAEGARQAR